MLTRLRFMSVCSLNREEGKKKSALCLVGWLVGCQKSAVFIMPSPQSFQNPVTVDYTRNKIFLITLTASCLLSRQCKYFHQLINCAYWFFIYRKMLIDFILRVNVKLDKFYTINVPRWQRVSLAFLFIILRQHINLPKLMTLANLIIRHEVNLKRKKSIINLKLNQTKTNEEAHIGQFKVIAIMNVLHTIIPSETNMHEHESALRDDYYFMCS